MSPSALEREIYVSDFRQMALLPARCTKDSRQRKFGLSLTPAAGSCHRICGITTAVSHAFDQFGANANDCIAGVFETSLHQRPQMRTVSRAGLLGA
jgi:hypothetical protein